LAFNAFREGTSEKSSLDFDSDDRSMINPSSPAKYNGSKKKTYTIIRKAFVDSKG
jgi:hypothetical protein